MKIVFVDPPGFTFGLNTGIGYLCGILKRHRYADLHVVDFNNMPGNIERRLAVAKDADIVGISIKSLTLKPAVEIAKTVKKINPRALVIAGGPHITLDAKRFLEEYEDFDACLSGEGEDAILGIAAKKDFKKIPGLYFRKGSEIFTPTHKNERISDLDKLPFPEYGVFDSVKKSGIREYPLVTSRGCPYQCIYCSVRNVMGVVWKARRPKNVIDELSEAKRKYRGLKGFKIVDDNFTLDMDRAKEMCKLLIRENMGLKWSCPNGVRADRLDEELLGLMKDSGCYSISIGVESLDKEVFEGINKGERLEDILEASRKIKAAGMRLEGFFIIGLPGSTYEKDMNTLKTAKKMGFDFMSWNVLVPYPGTPVWEWLIKNQGSGVRVLRDWKEGFHIGFNPKPVFETSDYTAKERVRVYRNAYLSTLNLKGVFAILKLVAKSKF